VWLPVARHGRRLSKCVAVLSASAQNVGAAPLWINGVRKQSLIVRRTRSVKPRIFVENPNPCTIAIVPGSVAIAYRTSHR
jgi:hypothetical protein